ncbi:MAG: hypothetical protein ACE5GN_03085 [Waddliaceae bacterium]
MKRVTKLIALSSLLFSFAFSATYATDCEAQNFSNGEHYFNASVDLTDNQIIDLVTEGIDAIYDLNVDYYKHRVMDAIYTHNSYKTGSPEGNVTSFTNAILCEMSKLGKEIPFKKRKFYWDYTCVVLTERINKFIDLFNYQRGGLQNLKDPVGKHIEKQCRANGIFG